ncbi:Cas9 inhibitor AcrIIA9 family protein [Enterococcus faecalis]|uniref:Cas9 inhibitor AcrIIA9 family protein n=1 Tax=Enterococcus faecalis TaxID=1351 RepID=UPI0034CFDF1E
MTNTKEQALAVMLKEMQEEHSVAEDKIHNWLCDQNDENLFQSIVKKGKSISNALNYCGQKAREMAMKGVAVVDDSEVYSWVKEYYLSDETDIKQATSKVSTSVPSKKTKTKDKPKPAKKEVNEGMQLDLLDFL